MTLDWHLSLPTGDTEGGILPFFIDWGQSRHPSETAAPGLTVVEMHGLHPDPGAQRVACCTRGDFKGRAR